MDNKSEIIKIFGVVLVECVLLFCTIMVSDDLYCHGYSVEVYNYDLSSVRSTDINKFESLKFVWHAKTGEVCVYSQDQVLDTVLLYHNNAEILEIASYKHKYYGDSIAVFYYRKKISPYRFCTLFYDETDYIPDSLSSEAQSFDYIEYMTDRHKTRYLSIEIKELSLCNKAKYADNLLRVDTLYLYVSSVYPDDIYAFSKESISRVRDYFYFDWGYNCYAVNVNLSIDLNKEGSLLEKGKYGSLYLIPGMRDFDIEMRMKKDVDGKYRLTGVIPGRDTLEHYTLYDDEWCFKSINKAVYNYFY